MSETARDSAQSDALFEKKSYQWYVLSLLTIVYVFNFIDRNILSILGQSIKEELQISDTDGIASSDPGTGGHSQLSTIVSTLHFMFKPVDALKNLLPQTGHGWL